MRSIIVLCSLVAAGCTAQPFIKVGVGANLESGTYGWDERCALGSYGAGFDHGVWTVEYDHTSCIDARPELVTNQIRVTRKIYAR